MWNCCNITHSVPCLFFLIVLRYNVKRDHMTYRKRFLNVCEKFELESSKFTIFAFNNYDPWPICLLIIFLAIFITSKDFLKRFFRLLIPKKEQMIFFSIFPLSSEDRDWRVIWACLVITKCWISENWAIVLQHLADFQR